MIQTNQKNVFARKPMVFDLSVSKGALQALVLERLFGFEVIQKLSTSSAEAGLITNMRSV
jgi:hypothetical protein